MVKIFEKIWNEINKYERITICTHITPDGDTIGSAIALKYLILNNTNVKEVKISGDNHPKYLSFMEKPENVSDKYFDKSLKVVVDTSTKSRIWDKRVVTKNSIKIDHHHDEGEWMLGISGDLWPANGQIISEMAESLKLEVPEISQEAIFVAIWTDTEGMKERNPTKETWKALERLTINKEDIIKKMELSDEKLSIFNNKLNEVIKNGKVSSIYVKETEISEDDYRPLSGYINNKIKNYLFIFALERKNDIRIGLRSSEIDVSVIANKYGGGGHKTSAGFIINNIKDFDMILKEIEKEVNNVK